MTLTRLSKITTRNPKLQNKPKFFPDISGLEEEIFPDFKSEDTEKSFYYMYRSAPVVRNDLAVYLGYDLGDLILGDYEYKLVQLLINSNEPVFCITGHMGSGKTSTIRHLIKIFGNGTCPLCNTKGDCPHRKYVMINFNQVDYPSSEQTAKSKLANDIQLKIKEALADTGAIDENKELSLFWGEMLSNLSKSNYEFRVFVHLRHIISEECPEILDDINVIKDPDDLKTRRKIRRKVLHDPEHGLEYYFHLWRYILKNNFDNRKEHLILFFDNIDNSNPAVQTALVKLLSTYATSPGVRCVVTVRPETFEASNLSRASGFIRLEKHEGPSPDQVVCNDIRQFVKKNTFPDKLYPNKLRDFEFYRHYFNKILEINEDRGSSQHLTLTNFIRQACGPSIRLGIKLADGFVNLDDELLSLYETNNLTTFHVIRSLIKRGNPFFHTDNFGKQYHPIENIFDVHASNENGRLLIKARILTYLQSEESNNVTIGDLRETLGRFGYTETELIRLAINDLQTVQRQLIRSTSLDGFQSPEEFQGAGTSKISITKIGEGYLDLIGNMDFLQEVMFDCRIDPKWDFPLRIEINSIHETLIIIWRFLNTLFHRDMEEIKNFLYTPNGYDDYIDNFGAQPLSWSITRKAYSSARKIIYSGLSNPSTPKNLREGYKDARGRFDHLLANIRSATDDLLSIKLDMPNEYDLRDED